MVGSVTMRRSSAVRWIPATIDVEMEYSGAAASLTDMVLGFFEEGEGSPGSCSTDDGDEAEIGSSSESVDERKAFWETQHQLLKSTLSRSNSLESKIRRDTVEAVRQSRSVGPATVCFCSKPVVAECRNCFCRDVSDRLRNIGYNSALCKSKWRRSPDIPSGDHTYIDVIDTTSGKKGAVRVVIELNFRAEFEMARASEEYNKLINKLPEVFVGKAEKLRNLIKILCGAAKKCMKENKMHMAPWRKHKYMQAKWLGTCERTMPALLLLDRFSDRQPSKSKTSMLTFDLLEKLPSLHCTAVQVV